METTDAQSKRDKRVVRWIVETCLVVAGWWTTFGFLMYAPLWMKLLVVSCVVIACVVLLAET